CARQRGLEVTRLAVPAGRAPAPEDLRRALRPRTKLAAIQWVNHETGTVLPVREYAAICRDAGVPLFVDAMQALGKLAIEVDTLGADLLACSAHKIGGPAGSAALWVRRGVELDPLLHGGAQERGRRGGTPDVLAHVGFGAACEQLAERLATQPRIAALRDRAELALLAHPGAVGNAPSGPRVATVSNVSVRGWRGEALIAALDVEGVAASSGAACSSGLSEPSPVLLAMHGDEPWRAGAALRLSFGVETTEIEVESALAVIARVLARPPA
ncbi:MAG TPA: aminotransferase class V-fold PLP-dependent enzyme, partial [Polyangiales bacterium]|nr:aminotransferase class V-fold PLP-dependent enzyme [Polyangiales bacterium]